MPVVADLSVNLTANTGRFREGMQSAKKDTEGFRDSMESIKSAVSGLLFLELGKDVAEAGHKMYEFVAHTIEAAEAVENLANRLGTTAEAIHGMHFAAALAGDSAENMDAAIQKMMVNIGKDTPEAAKAFAAMGLNIKDMRELGADEALEKIADGIRNVRTASERSALAVEIFGKSGAKMLDVLRGGADGLKNAAEKSELLRGSLSSIQSDNIREAAVAMKELKEQTAGAAEKLGASLAPAMTYLSILATGKHVMMMAGAMEEGGQGALSFEDLERRHKAMEAIAAHSAGRMTAEESRAQSRRGTAEATGTALQFGDEASDAAHKQEGFDNAWQRKVMGMIPHIIHGIFSRAYKAAGEQIKLQGIGPGLLSLGGFIGTAFGAVGGRTMRPASTDVESASRGTFSGEMAGRIGVSEDHRARQTELQTRIANILETGTLKTSVDLGN